MTGWVKLWRDLLEKELWLSEPFTRGQAFIDLVGLANHADSFIRVRGNRVEVKRGQCGWSEVKLAERWRWSRGRVRRFLNELENDSRIVQQKNRITTVISLVNYERYQGDGTTDGTTDGQQTVQQTDTNKNDKKEKNGKKNTFSSDSTEVGLSELLFELIHKHDPKAKEPDIQKWAVHIDRLLRIDGRAPDEIEAVIRWAQADGFWHSNILSTQTLRKQFAKLALKAKANQQRAITMPAEPAPLARDADGLTPRERALRKGGDAR